MQPAPIGVPSADVGSAGLSVPGSFETTLAAARLGEAWALRALYDELAPTVTGYLRLRGAVEPDDLTSETFLAVFRALERFEGDEAGFRSWVFTIAHRRLIDEHRRAQRRPATAPLAAVGAEVDVSADVETAALADELDPATRRALDRLSDEQRTVVLLRIVADLSVEQVAVVLGRRPGAVRSLQHRALTRLRRELAGRDPSLRSGPSAQRTDGS